MISIIVLSSDGYSDCWDPLFRSLLKYFPEIINHELILSTNSKEYNYRGLDIKCITHGDKAPWSKRLKNSLIQAKNDIVFIIVEDFFLRSRIDLKMFNEFVQLLNDDAKIDHIRLTITLNKLELKSSPYDNLDEIESKTKLRLTYLPGLWKKNIILKYAMDYESVFMSETIGRYRSWIYQHGFYAASMNYIELNGQFYDTDASGVLFKGKWPRWVPALFEKEGIQMDYSIRGIVEKEFRKKSRWNSKKQMIKSPISTLRSFFSVVYLYIRVKLFN